MSEQLVLVEFYDYSRKSGAGHDLKPLFDLEDKIEAAIELAGVGEFDGNAISQDASDGALYMYGPDAESLWRAVEPIVRASPLMRGAQIKLRFGPPEDDTPFRTFSLEQ